MSRTPAAHLARLKVTYRGWDIRRAADGFTAIERSTGRVIIAGTVGHLETALAEQP
jgi:hypothetical protein